MTAEMQDIGIAEFFAQNKQLLGFNSPTRALVTTVKELVDNSLDACEEAGLLPDIDVIVEDTGGSIYEVTVTDNGPGIDKNDIPLAFGRLLYGSRFHSLRQSRGQQGIGVSAAAMYSYLTTAEPIEIKSKRDGEQAVRIEMTIDVKENKPNVVREVQAQWKRPHGLSVSMKLEGRYVGGDHSVDEYLKQTYLANPHATISYLGPGAPSIKYARATTALPKQTVPILPHPYGLDIGSLQDILATASKDGLTVKQCIKTCFSGTSEKLSRLIYKKAGIKARTKVESLGREEQKELLRAMKDTTLLVPSDDCISPIGAGVIQAALSEYLDGEHCACVTRAPIVCQGLPLVTEAGIIFLEDELDRPGVVYRFANKVPLLYSRSSCAVYQAACEVNWKAYGLDVPSNSTLPENTVIIGHVASPRVPFESESKAAVSSYPEIVKEMKLAYQECGRGIKSYISRKRKRQREIEKRKHIATFVPHIKTALSKLLDEDEDDLKDAEERLYDIIGLDPEKDSSI